MAGFHCMTKIIITRTRIRGKTAIIHDSLCFQFKINNTYMYMTYLNGTDCIGN